MDVVDIRVRSASPASTTGATCSTSSTSRPSQLSTAGTASSGSPEARARTSAAAASVTGAPWPRRCATQAATVRVAPAATRPARELGPEDGQGPDRDLLRPVGSDLGQQVADVRVAVAVEQRLAVGGDVAGRQLEVGRSGIPPLLDPRAHGRVGDGLGDGLVPEQRAGVRHEGVGPVEQPQLARLEGVHVVDDGGAGRLPGRAPAGKGAGEHPFGERLGRHGLGVVDAGLFGDSRPGRRRSCVA